jgi:hypothetical protein
MMSISVPSRPSAIRRLKAVAHDDDPAIQPSVQILRGGFRNAAHLRKGLDFVKERKRRQSTQDETRDEDPQRNTYAAEDLTILVVGAGCHGRSR